MNWRLPSQTEVPVVESGRLRLRAHRREDFEACVALWCDPSVTRYIGGTPSTPQQSWARILTYAGLWKMLGFGYWAIEERETGQFIGEIGFADFKREVEPSFQDSPEMGWVLRKDVRGKGYAVEAARAALSWGDRAFGAISTVCMIAPENAPSIRVAEKCGFRPYGETVYLGSPTRLFRREPPV